MSLLVPAPLTPQKTVLSQSGKACSVQISRGFNITAPDKEMREFHSTIEKKSEERLSAIFLTAP